MLSCLFTFCCLKKLQNWFPAKFSAILKHKIIVPTKQKFANLQKSHIPAKFSCFSVSFINSSLCITFALWGGPSMTQGNTPSLQRENHTHTHTHTHTLQLHCLWQYQLNHTFPKQLIQKIYWELHKTQSQIKNRKEDHY